MAVTTHKTFCHAYRAIEVDVENGTPVAVRGDTDDPVYGGYTCIKGRQLPEQFTTAKRIRNSLKRRDDDDRTYDRITGMPRMSAIPVNLRQVREETI